MHCFFKKNYFIILITYFYFLSMLHSMLFCFFFFIFLGSKITADGDCSHEMKRCLLLGRKVMTNLDIFGEGNGNPLQYSCLENPTDAGAW